MIAAKTTWASRTVDSITFRKIDKGGLSVDRRCFGQLHAKMHKAATLGGPPFVSIALRPAVGTLAGGRVDVFSHPASDSRVFA